MTYLNTRRALRKRSNNLGSATSLIFTQQMIAGGNYTSTLPAIAISFVNSNCQVVGSQTGTIVVSFGANPGSATLTGTTTLAVQGAGSFNVGLTGVNITGVNYTIRASATGYATNITSVAFNIIPEVSAVSYKMVTQPSAHSAEWFVSPSVQVGIVNSNCQIVTSAVDRIVISLGANPGSAAFDQGTVTSAVSVDGIATFDFVRLGGGTISASGYTYRFSGSLFTTQLTSTAFDVDRAHAASMEFATQPSSVAKDAVINMISITLLSPLGNPAASAGGSFTVSTTPDTTLIGTTTQSQTGAGEPISFGDLRISTTGTYRLIISHSSLSAILSNQFTIS